MLPSKPPEEDLSLHLPSSCGPRCFLICGSIMWDLCLHCIIFCLCGPLSKYSSPYKNIHQIKTHPDDFILSFTTSVKNLFPNKVTFTLPGIRISTYLWGDPVQLVTLSLSISSHTTFYGYHPLVPSFCPGVQYSKVVRWSLVFFQNYVWYCKELRCISRRRKFRLKLKFKRTEDRSFGYFYRKLR